MELITTTEYDGRMPEVSRPDKDILKIIGEKGLYNLTNQHYNLLVKSEIKDIFPKKDTKALEFAKKKSADFLIQIMGGENYYQTYRGRPMLKKRHLPFPIDMRARIIWLECYKIPIKNLPISDKLKLSLWNYLDKFSLWMMNQ